MTETINWVIVAALCISAQSFDQGIAVTSLVRCCVETEGDDPECSQIILSLNVQNNNKKEILPTTLRSKNNAIMKTRQRAKVEEKSAFTTEKQKSWQRPVVMMTTSLLIYLHHFEDDDLPCGSGCYGVNLKQVWIPGQIHS